MDEYANGWKCHALGKPLPVHASDQFKLGWLQRSNLNRPTLESSDGSLTDDQLANIADKIDL